jgi:hypothetical protein
MLAAAILTAIALVFSFVVIRLNQLDPPVVENEQRALAASDVGPILVVIAPTVIFVLLLVGTSVGSYCLLKLGARAGIIIGASMCVLLAIILSLGAGFNTYALLFRIDELPFAAPVATLTPIIVLNALGCALDVVAAALTIRALSSRVVTKAYRLPAWEEIRIEAPSGEAEAKEAVNPGGQPR